jgi:hypothetical protein
LGGYAQLFTTLSTAFVDNPRLQNCCTPIAALRIMEKKNFSKMPQGLER